MAIDPKQVARDLESWDAISDHRAGTPGDHATDAWLPDDRYPHSIDLARTTQLCELIVEVAAELADG